MRLPAFGNALTHGFCRPLPGILPFSVKASPYFWIGEAHSDSPELRNPITPFLNWDISPDTQEDVWTRENETRRGVQHNTQPWHLSSKPVLKGLPSLFLVLSPSWLSELRKLKLLIVSNGNSSITCPNSLPHLRTCME